MQVMMKEGYAKEDIRRFCFEHTSTSDAELKRIHVIPGEVSPEDEARMRPLVSAPEDFIVVAAGGAAGAFSAYIPGWGSKRATESVTKEIRRP